MGQLDKVYQDIAADATLTAASMAPPPFGTAADVVSIGRSLWTGDWGGALLDTVGLIPVVGDGIKGVGKGTKIAAKLDKVADAIKAAKAVLARKKAALITGRKNAAKNIGPMSKPRANPNTMKQSKIVQQSLAAKLPH